MIRALGYRQRQRIKPRVEEEGNSEEEKELGVYVWVDLYGLRG